MRHRITEGVYSHRAVARTSAEWQAAYALTKGAKAFKVWRDQRNRGRKSPLYLRLHRFEFRGLDLAGAELSGLRLTSTIFEDCDLRGARLRGANLNGAEFRDCELAEIDFEQAKLVGTDFSRHDLTGINFYGSSRDGWRIQNVRCEYAWIQSARGAGSNPTHFHDGEFEFIYSGRKVVLAFPDDGQTIDLLALPFHFQRLQEEYPGSRISLVGLRFTPTAAMEIRIDSDSDQVPDGLETTFKSQVPATRREVEKVYATMIAIMQQSTDAHLRTILSQQEMIGRLIDLLGASQAPVGVLVQPGGTYVFADRATVSTHIGDQYFGLPASDIPALLAELETLGSQLASAPDPDLAKAVDDLKQAIEERDEDTAMKVARSAGKRLIDVVENVGTSILAKLLERMLGIGS